MNEFDFLNEVFSQVPFSKAESEDSLRDRFQTQEQRKRDEFVTRLLSLYVDAYDGKTYFVDKWRNWLIGIVLGGIVLTILGLITVAVLVSIFLKEQTVESVVSVVTAFASLLGVFVGLMKIITEYIFPKDDEKYITQIVQAIQKNDLENKRVNINAERKWNNKE